LNSHSTFPPDDDEDTIEVELTPAEMRRLSRAVRQAYTYKGRYRLWSVPVVAAVVGIAVGIAASIAWRSSPPHPIAQRMAPSPAAHGRSPAASPPVARAPPPVAPAAATATAAVAAVPQAAQDPPVRVRNPFDSREVFEFPPGTTKAEAREKVSQLLMQRAAGRRTTKD
jgi:hypothetical protein